MNRKYRIFSHHTNSFVLPQDIEHEMIAQAFDGTDGLELDWATGMNDVNGVNIYENDIISYKLQLGEHLVRQNFRMVTYSDIDASYILFTKSLICLKDCLSIEVVGNRHLNPELLINK